MVPWALALLCLAASLEEASVAQELRYIRSQLDRVLHLLGARAESPVQVPRLALAPEPLTRAMPQAAPRDVPSLPAGLPSACNVSLVFTQNKFGKCVQGASFGCEGSDRVWVSDGCRGIFRCNSGSLTRCGYAAKAGRRVCECESMEDITYIAAGLHDWLPPPVIPVRWELLFPSLCGLYFIQIGANCVSSRC